MSLPQRVIGDLRVSAVGLGCMPMSFEDMVDHRERALQTIHTALTLGITLIDTADIYAPTWDSVGHNELLVAEALRTYTVNAAWQDRAETWKGSLEVGKVADLRILAGDLLQADPHEIPSIPVRMTVLDCVVVHERDDTTVEVAAGLAQGPVAGHYGPSTRLVMRPHGCGCGYDRLVLSAH